MGFTKALMLSAVAALALIPASVSAWDTTTNPHPAWDCGDYVVDIQYDDLKLGEYKNQDPGDLIIALIDVGYGVTGWKENGLSIPTAVGSYRFDVVDMETYNESKMYLAYDKNTIAIVAISGEYTLDDRVAITEAMATTLDTDVPPRLVMAGDRHTCDRLPDL